MRDDRTAAVMRASQPTELRLRKWIYYESFNRSDKKVQLPQYIVEEASEEVIDNDDKDNDDKDNDSFYAARSEYRYWQGRMT